MHWPPGAPGLLRRQIGQRSDDLAVGVNSGRISATDVASAKSTRHGIPSPDSPMLAGVMSRCITAHRCIPATALAVANASPIRTSAARPALGRAAPPRRFRRGHRPRLTIVD